MGEHRGPPPSAFPEFRPRAPWLGADLQTLRNRIVAIGRPADVATPERAILALDDGDSLAVAIDRPAQPRPRPLLVLVHGLAGSEASSYLCATAAHFLALGYTVMRVNLRGAGPSRALCKGLYHAGRSADLDLLFERIDPRLTRDGIVAMGFSLGGNLILKLLGEQGQRCRIRAAVSVSAPIDLERTADRILARRNAPYHLWLLRRMKREALAEPDIPADVAELVRGVPHLRAFDERFVAPRNGFASAQDYYAKSSAKSLLGGISTPTLVIHALDDPWIPGAIYTDVDWSANPRLTPLLPRRGGHVGFHGHGSRAPWFDRCAELFFDRVSR